MNERDRQALAENAAWREFREWVRATVEMESNRAVQNLETWRLEEIQHRRDAFEDVWGMVLAFEKKNGS